MKFTKMHGLGNDYIFVDCFAETVTDPSRTAQLLSPAHFGVGADGLILIEPSAKADCRMRMFNADGTEGRMCGNGIRCVGKYMYDHGRAVKAEITVETLDGIKTLQITPENDKAAKIRVDMGVPVLESTQPEKITVAGSEWEFSAVDVGSPHAVYLVPNCEEVPLEKIGVLFEHAAAFRIASTANLCRSLTVLICGCVSGSAAAESLWPVGPEPWQALLPAMRGA